MLLISHLELLFHMSVFGSLRYSFQQSSTRKLCYFHMLVAECAANSFSLP